MTPPVSPRIIRETQTMTAMMGIYCHDVHHTLGELCGDCAILQAYAVRRLSACVYGAGKPACSKCPIHCYEPGMREKIRVMMRHSGPKMLLRHPWLVIRHTIDGLKNPKGTRPSR